MWEQIKRGIPIVIENKKNMGYLSDFMLKKLIKDTKEKYTQMSIGSGNLKWLYMFNIPEKYRMPVEATKDMSIDELHSACELCLNKYFSAVQNGIEDPPTLNAIVGYPMGENLLFYFAMEFLNKENKFIRVSDVKCSYTRTDNHKVEYEVTWTDGGMSLLNSEFQFIFQSEQSKPYKFAQRINVYDFDNRDTNKGVALFGRIEGMYYLNDDLYIIKTNGEFLQIPMNYEEVIMSLPMPYGILYKDSILLIEDRNGVYVFDIYRGYICYLKDKSLSNLNQEDMARLWFNQGITP